MNKKIIYFTLIILSLAYMLYFKKYFLPLSVILIQVILIYKTVKER